MLVDKNIPDFSISLDTYQYILILQINLIEFFDSIYDLDFLFIFRKICKGIAPRSTISRYIFYAKYFLCYRYTISIENNCNRFRPYTIKIVLVIPNLADRNFGNFRFVAVGDNVTFCLVSNNRYCVDRILIIFDHLDRAAIFKFSIFDDFFNSIVLYFTINLLRKIGPQIAPCLRTIFTSDRQSYRFAIFYVILVQLYLNAFRTFAILIIRIIPYLQHLHTGLSRCVGVCQCSQDTNDFLFIICKVTGFRIGQAVTIRQITLCPCVDDLLTVLIVFRQRSTCPCPVFCLLKGDFCLCGLACRCRVQVDCQGRRNGGLISSLPDLLHPNICGFLRIFVRDFDFCRSISIRSCQRSSVFVVFISDFGCTSISHYIYDTVVKVNVFLVYSVGAKRQVCPGNGLPIRDFYPVLLCTGYRAIDRVIVSFSILYCYQEDLVKNVRIGNSVTLLILYSHGLGNFKFCSDRIRDRCFQVFRVSCHFCVFIAEQCFDFICVLKLSFTKLHFGLHHLIGNGFSIGVIHRQFIKASRPIIISIQCQRIGQSNLFIRLCLIVLIQSKFNIVAFCRFHTIPYLLYRNVYGRQFICETKVIAFGYIFVSLYRIIII